MGYSILEVYSKRGKPCESILKWSSDLATHFVFGRNLAGQILPDKAPPGRAGVGAGVRGEFWAY